MRQPMGILVGVDESADSLQALDWAAREAAARRTMLTVCHVLRYEPVHAPLPLDLLIELSRRAREFTDRMADRARQAQPGLAVQTRFDRGHISEILVQLSDAAEEVVVGSRGTGGFPALQLGSVAAQLAAYARCPVTLIRGQQTLTGAVIVGVEGAERDRPVLEHAFRFASLHHLTVRALHTYRPPTPIPSISLPIYPAPGTGREAAIILTRAAIAPWTAKFPDVQAEPIVAAGHPAATLVDASHGAALLVVGSRGHGGFTGLLLGSVSQAVLRHAHCPVTIAR